MLDRGFPIGRRQLLRHAREPVSHLMECLDQAPEADAGLAFELAQRHAVEVVLNRHVRQELVPVETLGEDAGGSRGEPPPALRTLLAFQQIEGLLHLHGVAVGHGPPPDASVSEGTGTVGA